MKRGTLVVVLIAVVVLGIGGAVVMSMRNKSNKVAAPTATETQQSNDMNMQGTQKTETPADQQNSNTTSVAIKSFKYSPAKITIKKGSTVTWTNEDDAGHTVTSDNDSKLVFDSPLLQKGETYKFTFNEVGTFNYHCQPHPYMKATVEVTE